MFDTPHALTHAIVLPYAVKFVRPAVPGAVTLSPSSSDTSIDREGPCHFESFDVGEADVQQHEVRLQGLGCLEARSAVNRLTDHDEAIAGQDIARLSSKSSVVINDQDRAHASIVSSEVGNAYRAGTGGVVG